MFDTPSPDPTPLVALARRESHHRGRQHVGLARVLVDEMPCTRRALRAGRITEWKATLLARETACLSLEDRQTVDRRLAGDVDRLEQLGDRQLEGAARKLAGELDAAACVLRRRIAESERRVTLRPAPDTMSRLSAELPIRHTDHPQAAAADGETSRVNGQGLCEACNYAKEALGWSVTVVDTQPHTIEIRTPSGQVYRSQAPPLPGHLPRIDLAFCYSAA